MKPDRPKQETPAEMVGTLMGMIRGQFYGDLPEDKWFKDRAFVKKNVVLWPATWLNARGLTLPPERYQAILVEKLIDLKRHATGTIHNPSGYLMRCLQDHFRHHEDELHDEAKAFTASVDRTMGKLRTAPSADPVAALATAAAVIAPKRRQQGGPKGQGNLFICTIAAALLHNLCSGLATPPQIGSNQSQTAFEAGKVGSNLHFGQNRPLSCAFRSFPA